MSDKRMSRSITFITIQEKERPRRSFKYRVDKEVKKIDGKWKWKNGWMETNSVHSMYSNFIKNGVS